ncbi:hypothetical protein A9404_08460 [Halothiobacillus diazotrophicus]|uniref:DUF4124 domain-containing protein n=1 Tax=Halothiobacillus diazotrophicus TaxID=1860122 RepID=A0A191ZHT4_9GAMM|nr:DUF4124 domain-containing protein [Halothiobacillus diazotrophicus]ANJ67408.1 hypothetical protein A9404_08460 [Halothiobacillus diazotrophicus]
MQKTFATSKCLRCAALLAGLMGLILSPLVAEAELYRWTTPDGRLHYGDNMPSGQAAHGYDIINPATGAVIRHIDRAKTPEELAAAAAEERKREEAAKAAEEQAQKDRVLLQLYASRADIERARSQRLAEVNAQIKQVEDALKRADVRARSDQPSEVASANRDIVQLRKNLAELYGVREDVTRQFDHDLKRFDELKGARKAGSDR